MKTGACSSGSSVIAVRRAERWSQRTLEKPLAIPAHAKHRGGKPSRGRQESRNAPELDQRRLALRLPHRRRIAQIQNAPGVVVEQLLLVGIGKLDLVDQLEAWRRIPARIIGAVHDVVDA